MSNLGHRTPEELERLICGIKTELKDDEDESITELAGLDKDDILEREYPNKDTKNKKKKRK